MSIELKDGTGTGKVAKINGRNELATFTITESEAQNAAELGDAYNVNTGEISLSSSTSSGILYFKNDEDTDIIVEAIAFGLRDITGGDGSQKLFIIRNPTGGTLVDAATNVDMNENRNHGSSRKLKNTTLAYKPTASNQTLTGGSDAVMLYVGAGRSFATINLEIPRGSSIGFRLDCASITANCYAALIIHAKDSKR
jgi:hypothetical protein